MSSLIQEKKSVINDHIYHKATEFAVSIGEDKERHHTFKLI